MSPLLTNEIHFDSLPLWEGIQDRPGIKDALPITLGWNNRGFISQTSPQQVKDRIIQSYAKEQYKFITQPPGLSAWANRLGADKIEFVRQNVRSLENARILEIGAGSLFVAERLVRDEGVAEYVIVDPAVRTQSSSPEIQVLPRYFGRHVCPEATFDLVLAFSCFEHVPDPLTFLSDLREVLKRGQGQAILVFPDTEEQLVNGDLNVILHEHMAYFTKDTVQALFNVCGLKVTKLRTNHHSFEVVLEVADIPSSGTTVGVDNIMTKAARSFDENIVTASERLNHCLRLDETVALHGACNGLNNFLFLAGLEKARTFMIFDGDNSKTGKYLPACQTPIIHADDSRYRDVDKVFVAAITFYDEIKRFLIQKHHLSEENIEPLFPVGMVPK